MEMKKEMFDVSFKRSKINNGFLIKQGKIY